MIWLIPAAGALGLGGIWWWWPHRATISILVPFEAPRHDRRTKLWHWTRRYWRHRMRDAEIIVGRDRHGPPFSKAEAVNDAARRARGDVFIIMDADAYAYDNGIRTAIDRIRAARREGRREWFVPYRNFYRLTEDATDEVLASSPRRAHRFSRPPKDRDIEHRHRPKYGHHYGAMVLVLPREAFYAVGGMDVRFRGWGSEDVSFLFAVDELWAPHKTIDADVFHLWHPRIGGTWDTTMWPGQEVPGQHGALGMRYHEARGDPERMRALVDEGLE